MEQVMNVAIIGASGYSGAELAGLLLKHPRVRLNTLMTANQERRMGHRGNTARNCRSFRGAVTWRLNRSTWMLSSSVEPRPFFSRLRMRRHMTSCRSFWNANCGSST